MEKTTTRIGTVDQRLLTPLLRLRRFATRGAVVFFCAVAAAVYGQPHDGIELRLNGDIFFIDQDIEIEVMISHDSPYLRRNRDTPRFVFEGDAAAAQLIQSSVIPEYDGLHLRCRYRCAHAGQYVFSPALHWERQTLALEPLAITVHQPQLSPHTAFFWKLYSSGGEPLPDTAILEQGREYLLCLHAAFYSSGYAERYARMLHELTAVRLRNDAAADSPSHETSSAPPSQYAASALRNTSTGLLSQHESAASALHDASTSLLPQHEPTGLSSHNVVSGLPLPPEITRIECPASENAAFASLSPEELSVLAVGAASLPVAAFETYILDAFRWIPLQTGMQNLPHAQISFAAGGSAVSNPGAYLIDPLSAAASGLAVQKALEDGVSTSAAFAAALQEPSPAASDLSAQAIAAAKKIAEYRLEELYALFPFAARRERKKLEASLGGVPSLPLYPYILGIAAAAVTVLLAAGAGWHGLCKKKRLMLLFAALMLCCGSGAVGLFARALQAQAVCVAPQDAAVVRRIPESTGSIVHRLAVGEAVLIVRKTAAWYYVKTSGGISGWVPQRSLLVCEKRYKFSS